MSSPVKSRRLSSKRLSVLPMGRKGTDAGMSATMVSQMYAKILKMSTENVSGSWGYVARPLAALAYPPARLHCPCPHRKSRRRTPGPCPSSTTWRRS